MTDKYIVIKEEEKERKENIKRNVLHLYERKDQEVRREDSDDSPCSYHRQQIWGGGGVVLQSISFQSSH